MATLKRDSIIRRLAERASSHEGLQTAVWSVVRQELPGILEEVLSDMADAGEYRFRIYPRKRPVRQRRQRDELVRKLLGDGVAPAEVADRAKCSLSHVYSIRARDQTAAAQPDVAVAAEIEV